MANSQAFVSLCDLTSGVVLAHCFREVSPWWLSSNHLGAGNAWWRLFVPFSTFVFTARDRTQDFEHIAQCSTTLVKKSNFCTLFLGWWAAERKGHIRWGQSKQVSSTNPTFYFLSPPTDVIKLWPQKGLIHSFQFLAIWLCLETSSRTHLKECFTDLLLGY